MRNLRPFSMIALVLFFFFPAPAVFPDTLSIASLYIGAVRPLCGTLILVNFVAVY